MDRDEEIEAELEYLYSCLKVGLDTSLTEKVMERIVELQRKRAEQNRTD